MPDVASIACQTTGGQNCEEQDNDVGVNGDCQGKEWHADSEELKSDLQVAMSSDTSSATSKMQEGGEENDAHIPADQRSERAKVQEGEEGGSKSANPSNATSETNVKDNKDKAPNPSNVASKPNKGEGECDDESALLAIEEETGVRHRRVRDNSDANNEGEVIPNPLTHKNVGPGHWLTVKDVKDKENGGWRLILEDENVKNFLMNALGACFDHYGNEGWQDRIVEFTNEDDFFPLLYYWKEIESLCMSSELDGSGCDLRNRLKMLLQYARHFAEPSVSRALWAPESTTDFYFLDLWVLFRAGTLIVAPWFPGRPDIPQVFKVDSIIYENSEDGHLKARLRILAWVWSWDDSHLVRKMYQFPIENYNLTRNPCSLACYPLSRYKHEGRCGKAGVLAHEIYRQRKALFHKHTVEMQPDTGAPPTYSGDAIKSECYAAGHTRHQLVKLDEPIIIDATNHIRNVPQTPLGDLQAVSDTFLCGCKLCLDDNTKAWVKAFENGMPSEGYDDNDLLLAPRVLGYALGRKAWCQFLISHICIDQSSEGDTSEHEIIFPDQYPEDEQDDVLRMVRNHHRMMAKPVHQRLSDQISSKGDSLILLFHGSTGTGKTLYAEWLSNVSRRPLYKVGISDIGLEANEAERNLKQIFELADGWKAILLIDEADVLLDARGKANEGSHKKNALVSVLLREVEYFKGILILTTNRVSAFDAAVLSRLHHAINFGVVTKSQEERIWRLWFEKAKKLGILRQPDEVEGWISSLNKKRSIYLNGREIRNIFLIAQDLHEDGLIHRDDLKRIYDWKISFRDETNNQTISADQLLAPCY